MPYRFEQVPGYTVRSKGGTLIGYSCPITRDTFTGPNAERDQYAHTLAIMQAQGPDFRVTERRNMYLRGVGQ